MPGAYLQNDKAAVDAELAADDYIRQTYLGVA